jgi:predicted glycogen debranching enzyme
LVGELFPKLVEILERRIQGSRFGVGVDPVDSLLRIEEAPVGLTWMNAQDGDRVVTPRTGKPVEVNALWYNAVRSVAALSAELRHEEEAARWLDVAQDIRKGFEDRFWNEKDGCLYDVVDGPDGDDPTLRPNQILAVSLPYSPLREIAKARAVVDTVNRHLQTSYGLRTLSTRAPAYNLRYGGNRSTRANAYHQGTVWAWLIGPFAVAHYRVYGDLVKARSFLRPFADHLANHGVGTVSEIFDGNPPHTPRGCIASACSVAEVLCGWLACSDSDHGRS